MKLKLSEIELKSLKEDAINFILEDDSSWGSSYYAVLELNSLENTWDDLLMEAVEYKLVSLRGEIKDIKSILNDEEAEGSEQWVTDQEEEWGEYLASRLRNMKSIMIKKYNKEYNYIDEMFSRDFFIFYNDLQSLIITDFDYKQADFNRLEGLRWSQLDLFCYIRNCVNPNDRTANPFLPVINNSFSSSSDFDGIDVGVCLEHYYLFEIEKLQEICNIKFNCNICNNDFIEECKCERGSNNIVPFISHHFWNESLTEKIIEFFRLTPEHLRYKVAKSFLSFFNKSSFLKQDLFINLKKAQDEIYSILEDLELVRENTEKEINDAASSYNDSADEDELKSLCELRDLCVAHTSGAYDENSKLELADEIGFDEEDNGLEFNSLIKGFNNLSYFQKAYPGVGSNFVKIPINSDDKIEDLEPLLFITYKNDFLFYVNLLTEEITQVNR